MMLKEFFAHSGALRSERNEFFVVKRDAESLSEFDAEFSAAAAELTAYSDNLIQYFHSFLCI